jgi:hypothetical protein
MKRIYILIVLCILSEWVKGQVCGNQNYISTQTYITSDKQKCLEQMSTMMVLESCGNGDKGVTPDSKDLVSYRNMISSGVKVILGCLQSNVMVCSRYCLCKKWRPALSGGIPDLTRC